VIYIGFLYWVDELSDLEKEAFKEAEDWIAIAPSMNNF
jgi:hypothetical protein